MQIQEIDFHIDRTTTIICTDKVDVEKYNTIVLQKTFSNFRNLLSKNGHKCYKHRTY
jgi:hypothetical protein